MLASKVLKRQMTLEEGVVGAVARDQLASFANSFNAILGRTVLSRYRCESMLNARAFPTLDEVLQASNLEIPPEAADLPLEDLFPESEEPVAEQAEAESAEAPAESPLDEAESDASSGEGEPESQQPYRMLDLHALEALLAPRLEEIEQLTSSRKDIQHAISRLEWYASTRKEPDALPPGVISFSFLFVFALVCIFLFLRDRMLLALIILIPVLVLDGLFFYYEISAARARARERARQEERRAREMDEQRRRLSEVDTQLEQKMKEIETLKAQIKTG